MAFDYSSVKNKKRKYGKKSGFDYSSVVGKTERTDEEKREYVKRINSQKNDIRNNPDYAEVSKRGRAKYQQFYDDRTSNWFGNWVKDTYAGKLVAPQWEKYSEEEKDMYGYLYETDRDKANKYMLELNKSYETAERKKKIDTITEWAEEKPVMASVASLVANVGAPIDYIKNVGGGMATEQIFGEGVILPRTGFSDVATAMQSGVQKRIEENTDVEVLGENVAAQLYGMGMSIANSAALITAMGPLAVVEMSMQAAASATNEALDRGVSDVQAVKYGTAAGVAEALGEYLSIEHLFKLKSPHTIKQAIKSALAQAGVEASEEAVTTVMNSISDFVINGDKSEYATQVAFYLSEGYSQKEAEGKATWDSIKGLTWDAIGGAVSGLVLGGGSMALGSGNTKQEKNARKAVKDLGKDRDKILDFAMKTEEGSEVRKAAEDIVARTEKGEKVSNKEYADLLLKTDDNFAKAEIKRQLEAEATSTGEELSDEQLDSMSTAMLKTMRGNLISETENAQIEQSQSAKNVYARNMGVDYTYGEQLSKEKEAELIETRTQQVLSEAVKDQSEGYKQTLTKAYEDYAQGNESFKMDAEDFVNEFSSFYDIGRAGVESVDRALEAYGKGNPQLTNALARAYELGRGENRAENIAQAEIKQQAIKKGVKGKIVFEGNVKNRIRNKQQAEAINFMANVLKDTTNMEYHIFASYEKNGERYYKDSNGNEIKAPNGFYNPDTHQIWIDINAGSRGQGIMLYTLTHEHVHDIRVWSAEHYNELLDIAIQTFEAKGMDFEKAAQYKYESYIKNHPDYTMEDAREEVVAEMMSGLLSDEKGLAEFSKQIQQKDASLWNRIKAWFKDVIARLSKAYEDTLPESYEARMLMENKELFERAQKVFAEAVVTAGENYRNAGVEIDTNTDSESFRVAGVEVSNELSVNDVIESGGSNGVVAKFQDRTEYEEAPKQIFTISTTNGTSKSKMLTNKDKSNKLVSVKELRDQKFKENGFTVDEIDTMNKFIKGLADYMEKARVKYRFIGLQDVYDAKIVLDPMTNKIVLSAMVKNSEYSVNFDFTKVCKKRVALQEVIEQLTREKGRKNEDGSITEVDLSPANIKSINDILAKMGFETACLGCFVESKRYAMQNFYQDLVVDVWNRLVDEINPNAEYFGFADQNVDTSKIPDSEFFDLQNQSKAWAKKKGKAKNVEQKMREYLRDNPAARKKLTLADLATANGRTNLAKLYPYVDSLIKSKLGQSAPKSVEVFTPYNGEIDLLEARGKGDLAKYLKKIGGARSQSFSDFIITHVFDVLQKTASLSARKFTAHTYTKEIVRAQLFGLTGEKHNLSVIHNIDPNVDSWNAGLGKNGQYLNADYEAYMKGESDFIQSIGVKDAIKLQNTEGYSKDNGIIAVGFSYNHMMKMHDDPEIRQIIGYHASQLPVDIKDKTHLGKAADYTHVQNTLKFKGFRVVNYKTPNGVPSYATPPQDIKEISGAKSLTKSTDLTFDIKAKFEENARGKTGKARTEAAKETLRQFLDFADANNLVPVVSKAEGALGEFDIYADSEMTQNPYLTADHYIEYCMERGYLPAFFEFGLHQNYYKNIYDFDPFDRLSYNPKTGLHEDSENRKAYAPQRPVHMLNEDGSLAFPDNFIEIVDKAMKGYDKQRQRETEMMPEAMEKIRAVTNSKKFQDRDSDYMAAVESGDMKTAQKLVEEAAKEAGYTRTLYHGTASKFNVFGFGRAGIYTTDNLDVAKTYGDNIISLYGKQGTNVLTVDAKQSLHYAIKVSKDILDFSDYPLMRGKELYSTNDISRIAFSKGYDVVVIKNVYDNFNFASDNKQNSLGTDVVYKDSNQVKSSAPVTYDDNGNVIPLSERFRKSNPDIRYQDRDTTSKPRSAQAQRDEGYMLNENKFYQFYSIHQLDIGGRWGSIDEQIKSIRQNGFHGGSGAVNVLPASSLRMRTDSSGNPIFSDITQRQYAPKKGDAFLLVPKSGLTKDMAKVEQGFKPLDYEIVTADYDYQSPYEMYEKAYKTSTKGTDIRYQLRDVEPVQPSSDKWQRTSTTSEVMARFPDLWNVAAEESEVRNPTQITGTARSYRKIYDFLKDEGFDGKILDASSGLGYGTKAGIEEYGFDVEDIEPYPDKKYHPKYKDYSKLNKKYDVIISNAVLNVIPQDQRDALVVKMGELLNEGGRMFINVRGKDVENASSKVAINEDLMEYYISSTGSYQKGFTKPELVAYLQDALGNGYDVKATNMFGAVSAVVTKETDSENIFNESSGDAGVKLQDRLSVDDRNRVEILENQEERLVNDIKTIEKYYGDAIRQVYEQNIKPNEGISKRAEELNRKAARRFMNEVGAMFQVPKDTREEYLLPIIKEMIDKGPAISDREGLIERLYQTAYEHTEDYIVDTDPEGNYKNLRNYIRKTSIFVNAGTKADVGDYNNFRKHNMGSLRLTNDQTALGLDEFYDEVSNLAPEIFSGTTDGAEQLYELSSFMKDRGRTESIGDYMPQAEYTAWADETLEPELNKLFDSTVGSFLAEASRKERERQRAAKVDRAMENVSGAIRNYEAAQDYARAEGVLAGQIEQGKKDAAEMRRMQESFERKAKNYEDMLEAKRAKIKEIRQRRDEILAERKAAFEAYREQRNEAIRSGGTRKSIEKNAKTLMDWLLKNSDKEHVPEVLKTTVGDFLETIDFTSKRGLAGGEPTKKDQAFAQKLNSLAAMLEKQRNYMNKANEGDAENPLDCFLDLPEGFAEEVRKLADDVAKTAIGGNFVINDMNSVQLAQLNKALRILKTSISKMNKLITNAHFASVTEAARSSMLEMAEYKAHKPMNDISEQADKMLRWEMFTPVYAFKRYGRAGESIFKGIQKGWSDFAFAIDKVLKFTERTYTDKEVEAWEKETHSIKLSDGKTVTLTTAQLMSLYCLNKREQARGHIYGGGIRIADIKEGKVKIQQTEPYLVSFEDVETLIAELSDRQIEVADKLQKFMTEQGSEWGNKVSMERFGYRAFTEENYFPIESDANNLIAIDPEAKANDMFRLLNMSATKSLTKGANNAIVISDIFDIFSNHMSDMAKYGSLALPILDTMKWYNYKVRYDVGDGQFRTETVQKSVERAYGKAGKSYFTNFMKDLNGVKEGGRGIGFLSKMTSNYKIASVGANLRVALLQPTSIVRASMEIEPKYILKALTKLPAAKKAESKSGIALWKSLGYYNTDIARGVREQIKGGGKTVDKIRDKTMFLAEQMDRITFGTLWNAAEAKAKDLGYSGEELDVKTTEIFDDIIYKTQVVDSTLTRSSLMRSTNELVKNITAFMAEPTLGYNMVAETVYDMAKERDFSTGWQKNSKRFGKAVAVYTASSIAAAVIESIPDAFRDDDDDEWFGQKWWQAFWGEKFWDGNLLSEINILEKIPLLKDFISVRKGYDIQRLDAAWMASLNKAYEINTELFNVYVKGEKPTKTTYWGNMTAYGAVYANLRALSQISGLPVSNTVRDVVAIWNTIVGRMAPSLKLKTYDDSKKK